MISFLRTGESFLISASREMAEAVLPPLRSSACLHEDRLQCLIDEPVIGINTKLCLDAVEAINICTHILFDVRDNAGDVRVFFCPVDHPAA